MCPYFPLFTIIALSEGFLFQQAACRAPKAASLKTMIKSCCRNRGVPPQSLAAPLWVFPGLLVVHLDEETSSLLVRSLHCLSPGNVWPLSDQTQCWSAAWCVQLWPSVPSDGPCQRGHSLHLLCDRWQNIYKDFRLFRLFINVLINWLLLRLCRGVCWFGLIWRLWW